MRADTEDEALKLVSPAIQDDETIAAEYSVCKRHEAMAASAVIDRIIHHGSIFEFSATSHRLRSRMPKVSR